MKFYLIRIFFIKCTYILFDRLDFYTFALNRIDFKKSGLEERSIFFIMSPQKIVIKNKRKSVASLDKSLQFISSDDDCGGDGCGG